LRPLAQSDRKTAKQEVNESGVLIYKTETHHLRTQSEQRGKGGGNTRKGLAIARNWQNRRERTLKKKQKRRLFHQMKQPLFTSD
jgi:hypothetical protein